MIGLQIFELIITIILGIILLFNWVYPNQPYTDNYFGYRMGYSITQKNIFKYGIPIETILLLITCLIWF